MKRFFKAYDFRGVSQMMIDKCNDIIERYQDLGLRLTLRQLYYQLVTVNAIPNQERSYKNLSSLVSKARLAGLIDWDAIEDRVRQPDIPQEFDSISHLVETALRAYRLPRWENHDHYVELWVEKDALAGVLSPLASKHHVTLMVNRGYSSQSAMYESAARFRHNGLSRENILLYLGDFDPSGEDMVRDIRERMAMFEVDLEVEKIALTWDQIQQYKPPPNPAKLSDPRASNYIAQYGNSSWEVDALDPAVLSAIVDAAIKPYVIESTLRSILAQEKRDREALRDAAQKIMEGDE